MKKLGLENKLREENAERILELEKELSYYKALAEERAAQLELKENAIRSFVSGDVADCLDKYQASITDTLNRILDKISADGYPDLAEYVHTEFSKKEEFMAEIMKKLNFLSLSATKKSERFVPRDENGLAEGQTVDPEDKNLKRRKIEDAKSRGNNGARHDQHTEVPYEQNVIEVFPEGYNAQDQNYQIVDRQVREKMIYVGGYFKKQLYYTYKVLDRKTGKIISAELPDSPIKGSLYGSSFLADLAVSKFGWHQSITITAERYRSTGFNANEVTLDGLIMKLSTSLFFRNLDRVLHLAIIEDKYILADETHSKMRTDTAKLDGEFISECWVWGMLAMNIRLVRYSCDGGSRRYDVGYELVNELDHSLVMQSDAYGCYINMGKSEFIERIGCMQHTKRRFQGLRDPRAVKISEMFRWIYHLDHQRTEQAKSDALVGKEWTFDDHLAWRRDRMLPAFDRIVDYIKEVLEKVPDMADGAAGSSEQPLSKELRSAMNYTLKEAEALRKIFTCGIICDLDQNDLECANRSFSYHRRSSLAFGSVRAGENQPIFISLIESAKMHKVNLAEYMKFLLEQMACTEDGVVKNRDSRNFELYRNMLPDRYAETHKAVQQTYDPPAVPEGPLNHGSKRCGYKKHASKKDARNPEPNPDVG